MDEWWEWWEWITVIGLGDDGTSSIWGGLMQIKVCVFFCGKSIPNPVFILFFWSSLFHWEMVNVFRVEVWCVVERFVSCFFWMGSTLAQFITLKFELEPQHDFKAQIDISFHFLWWNCHLVGQEYHQSFAELARPNPNKENRLESLLRNSSLFFPRVRKKCCFAATFAGMVGDHPEVRRIGGRLWRCFFCLWLTYGWLLRAMNGNMFFLGGGCCLVLFGYMKKDRCQFCCS